MAENDLKNIEEMVIFSINDFTASIDVAHVQEIIKKFVIMPVYHTPDYVRGVMNLRGDIVTVIDFNRKLINENTTLTKKSVVLIIPSGDGFVGLLVDEVLNVAESDTAMFEELPSHFPEHMKPYFSGVYKDSDDLIAVVNFERIIES